MSCAMSNSPGPVLSGRGRKALSGIVAILPHSRNFLSVRAVLDEGGVAVTVRNIDWPFAAKVTSVAPDAASEWPTVANPSRPARFAAKPFMHQHLEECLVSDALSRCEFSGLGYIGFGQSQRNLDAGDLVQLTDKARTPRRPSLLPGSRRLLLYELKI